MNFTQIENNIQQLFKVIDKKSFIYDLLLCYGVPKATIKRLRDGGLNLGKTNDEIVWKKKLYFREEHKHDLHDLIDDLKDDFYINKHDPRFVIVTDFRTLLAIDRKTNDTLDISFEEYPKHFDFFLPLAGMEKAKNKDENPADIKAAEKMAKLFDEIKRDNPTKNETQVHNLNVFLSRLLFCFFAEDTGIFGKKQFTKAITSHTQPDGSDLSTYLNKLFDVMNRDSRNRKNLPAYLEEFPYVNGGLFRKQIDVPKFTKRSREAIIASGELDWSVINPDIFGSMMQAVVTPEQRGGLGMHYTSVPNIMKVIEPLFLTKLNEEFEKAIGNKSKLEHLVHRIWKIKIFDPACGSGNFLIIAYKELRRLEMKILKELNSIALSNIKLSNFYGIELDDFAHEIAILSLWLAEHQMNLEFLKEFGRTKPALPLKDAGNIICGNACKLSWESICPYSLFDEIYLLGNPPYLGSSLQSDLQKNDLIQVFMGFKGFKNLDYISCWFYKASQFIHDKNIEFAFVSTNSICQGEQVALLWPKIYSYNLEISFAHTSFKWSNNAQYNAGVTVIIVGVRNKSNRSKYVYKENIELKVSNINSYLIEGPNLIFDRRSKSISDLPDLVRGSMPTDGGNFSLTKEEKDNLIQHYPNSIKYIKKYLTGDDFLNDNEKFCLWITDEDLKEASKIPFIRKRLDAVREFRLNSDAPTTVEYAKFPNRFRQIAYKDSDCIVIPLTSSERRKYIPIKFLQSGTVATNSAGVVYNSQIWHFSILTSLMHNIWIKNVCGSLESRIRYSSVLGYNNFPFPTISNEQQKKLEKTALKIMEEREKHSEKTLVQLYDPEIMPDGLKDAHFQNDLEVERCYRSKPFESDEERLEYLFRLYEQMIVEETNLGTLFEIEKKKRKNR
ncbi:MAG TPA: class I SAM-dependent DNA methyltransferase [Ignavibacteria bacterium]|nr:SAM-dependent methyltransferase [Bacteroidota bacterium]HRE10407.1 class I SAM-dependent DNA methyltransferase [Ignavibacteria bacterium]HRF65065.1 class I SAM-dependent DNA methyltransferase [Ignavibacteria bacterium]